MSGADLGAGMLEDTGDERRSVASGAVHAKKRHRSSPKEDGDADQAEFLEQDAGIQRQDQGVFAPVPQSTSDQGTVDAGRVNG
ncbi:hypothetical protein GCM10022631_02890 [Deinococcus rubellus]